MSDKPAFFAELKRRNVIPICGQVNFIERSLRQCRRAPTNLIDPVGNFVGQNRNQ
jgi:hypothetical protein